MKNFILCLAAGFFFAFATHGQENQFRRSQGSLRYWLFGIGGSYQSMYDEAVSPVRYRNTGLTFTVGLTKQAGGKWGEFYLSPSFVKLKTRLSNGLRPMEVSTTRAAMSYQLVKKFRKWNDNTTLYLGGHATLLFNLKRAPQLDNSQLLYDYALSIGPSGKLVKEFWWTKRKHQLAFNLAIPVLSHIARPYYLNRIEFIDPENDFTGDLFRNSSIAFPDKFLRITSAVSVTRPLFSSNAIKISYQWDFYKAKTINRVFAAEHVISFIFMSNY